MTQQQVSNALTPFYQEVIKFLMENAKREDD